MPERPFARGRRPDIGPIRERFYHVKTDRGPVSRAPAAGEIQRAHATRLRDSTSPRDFTSRRDSILDAVVEVVAERGVAGAAVGLVIVRAQVSRRAFYECFASLEDALIAVMNRGMQRATPLIVRGFAGTDSWQDGMRCALAAMLAFCDSERTLVRVCLMEAQTAGPLVRAHRERILEAFRALVVERIQSEVSPVSQLAPEGVLASVVGIVNSRLIAPEPQPLLELLGPLMGLIVGPFMDEAQVQREIERGNELARAMLAQSASRAATRADADTRVRVPAALLGSRAHRARLCLIYVAEQNERGLSPSNRQVGDGVDLSHRGQVARLLGKLAALGLLVKRSAGEGYPNAWSLTPKGEAVARALAERW